MREQDVCLELFLSWLAERRGQRFVIDDVDDAGANGIAAAGSGGTLRLAVEVHPLIEPTETPPWPAARDTLAAEIAAGLSGSYALWLPPGAGFPRGGDEAADLARRVRETASALEPGERASVELPVSIYLKKQQREGALVSVVGGLSAHWARLSEKVSGTYDLDSSRLHRLPHGEERLERLKETIWEQAAALEAVGEWTEIEAADAWTVQRLEGGEGVTIVGRAAGELADTGLRVRRNFRRILADAGPRLRDRAADIRAVVVLGFYTRMEDEGATVALRGYDPSLYAGINAVCLIADGEAKPLVETRTGPTG